jgi:hypothetical protein
MLTNARKCCATNIDFNPKALKREISKQFKTDSYHLAELFLSDSSNGKNMILGKFYKLFSVDDNLLGYIYIGRVNSCRNGGCSSPDPLNQSNEFEFFDYFIIYNISNSILNLCIYNYEASHGQEITAKGWLKQFRGYDGSDKLEVGKEIDAISGATISVNSIVDDIVLKTHILQKYL